MITGCSFDKGDFCAGGETATSSDYSANRTSKEYRTLPRSGKTCRDVENGDFSF